MTTVDSKDAKMELFDKTDPNWPPDPAAIDLSDGSWITIGQATGLARVERRTIERWITERDISILVGGRRWISRRRLMGQ